MRELLVNLSLLLYLLFSVPLFAILIIFFRLIDWSGKKSHALATCWLRWLLKVARVELEVRGLEHLKPGQSYVFAANHQSYFDVPVLGVVLPYQVRWLAKDSLFLIPFFGWALKAVGYIPVNRDNPRQGLKSLEAAAQKLKDGLSVVIFPEGTRSPDGSLLSFKTGGFVLAIKSGRPVVPVAVCGTGKIMPRGRWWVRPGQVKIKIDQPVVTRGLSTREKKDLADLVYLRIKKMLSSGCI